MQQLSLSTRQSLAALTIALVGGAGLSASAEPYVQRFQEPFGRQPVFHMAGNATDTHAQFDPTGDGWLASVEMPDGTVLKHFYKPVGIHRLTSGGDMGHNHHIVQRGMPDSGFATALGRFSNDSSDHNVTQADLIGFRDALQTSLADTKLTHYVDAINTDPHFSFIIEFEQPLMDNDDGPDEFGELLYFERGAGNGNSWLTIQAVERDGTPLGPPLAISPDETAQTVPAIQLTHGDANSAQRFGAVAIDLSRLGVSETRYLRVRHTIDSDPGYRSDIPSDKAPDFKFLAIITHPDQLKEVVVPAELDSIAYD